MKQNSSILFHDMRKLFIRNWLQTLCCTTSIAPLLLFNVLVAVASAADNKPEYLVSFDPAKGFKPAQSDLTEVFLQIAGSLEAYGRPEPYLLHMKAEHSRIEAKYRQRFGRASKAYWPAYMDDAYFEKFSANWQTLAPKLGLVALAKNTGNGMRDAINGTRGTGTILVEIFNAHQKSVMDRLAGKSVEPADFDALEGQLIKRLYLDQSVVHDAHFSMAERDAEGFAAGIRGSVNDLFSKLDAKLDPAVAAQVKAAVTSMFIDVGRLAQAELEAAIIDSALNRQAAAKPANAH